MRIALDATYSTGSSLSGVGVYSLEILKGLAATHPATHWDWFYRFKPWRREWSHTVPANVQRRLLTESWGSRTASLFHGLNQRLPARRFARQIVTFHDLFVLSGEYSTADFRQRFARQAREAAAGADLIIAVSGFTADQIETLLKVPRARLRVIHHGVLQRTLPDIAREPIVLSVGVLQRRKNQATLVRAFRALTPEWTLILAGAQGGYEAHEVLNAIRDSGCEDRIRVTGFLSDGELARLYARASVFAFPSFDEGFGMPVIEAMAAGIPVITSNRSALPEVTGGAALLIDPDHDDELAGALLTLAADPALRNRLGAAGRVRATDFTWSKAIGETWKVYQELLS